MKLIRLILYIIVIAFLLLLGFNIYKDIKNKDGENYTIKDNLVTSSLEYSLESIDKNEVDETFKNSAKATFINIVDFLFYDGTINGVKFSDLSENGKKKVLDLSKQIDEKIEEKVPNYKEDISSKTKKAYNEASRIIKDGANNLDNFMKEKLSEENYNAIKDAKEDLTYYTNSAFSYIKENGSKVINNIKNKLSEWYQNFKNN